MNFSIKLSHTQEYIQEIHDIYAHDPSQQSWQDIKVYPLFLYMHVCVGTETLIRSLLFQ